MQEAATQPTVPAIFVLEARAEPASALDRVLAGTIALAALSLLLVACWLTPASGGVDTHTQLGLARCGWLSRSGIPCMTCGMTTSFALVADGRLLAALWVQPFGTVLALLTVFVFWVAGYIAVTARPVWRLLPRWPAGYTALLVGLAAGLAWGWKIAIHLLGLDGC